MKKRTAKTPSDRFSHNHMLLSDILSGMDDKTVADPFVSYNRIIGDDSAHTTRRGVATDAGLTISEGVRLHDDSICKIKPDFFVSHGQSAKIVNYFSDDYFIGWQFCAILAQHPFISRACSIPGEDAISVGYNISRSDNSDGDEECAKYMAESKALGLNETLRQLDANKRVFGVAVAVPCFDDNDIDFSSPMNLDGLKGKKFIGWKVIDPYWLTPVLDERSMNDPTYRDFYKPTWWSIPFAHKDIHKSWCVCVVNTVVADILKPVYYYGGVPLTQMIYKRVYSADKVANEAQMLAMSKRMIVMEANIQKMVANPEYAKKTMDAYKFGRDNWGVSFVNPGTKVQQLDTYLTEFNQLIMTQYQLVASIAQMPATKLLKVTPTGFQSTGQYEWKDYAQNLVSIQNNEFKPLLEKNYEIMSMCESGKANKFEVKFNEIDVPTLKENAEIAAEEAKAMKMLRETNVIKAKEARKILASKAGSKMASLKINDK